MTRYLSASEAKRLADGPAEVAFVDVREAGQFGDAHPLLAVPCPYSRLELQFPPLVPRLDAPVLLTDAGDGVAEKAAGRLDRLGYSDVGVIAGGTAAWADAGYTLFKGVNVPSKTLGELVESIWHPRTIDAATLAGWQAAGKRFGFFDARPVGEYAKMRVPGAVCLPNGELLHRYEAAIADPDMPIVVTCAGRTRGIVGAIGLKLAGIPNPVFALENGTQGWALAGNLLERGNRAEPFPTLTPDQARAGRERARSIAQRWSLPWIGAGELDALREDRTRTLYLFDVRSAEEFAAGHLPGAVHAPSGQIVQAADQWIGVRRARVVLTDDNGSRATIAAFWLRQLGFDVYIMPVELPIDRPTAAAARPEASHPVPEVSATEARRWIERQAVLLDLRNSSAYRAGTPAGAVWTIRPRLADSPGAGAPAVLLVADDSAIAALAAVDLRELGTGEVAWLRADLDALAAAGLAIGPRSDPTPEEAIDFLTFVHDRHDGNLEASRRYLEWEQGLVAQLDEGERATFRLAV